MVKHREAIWRWFLVPLGAAFAIALATFLVTSNVRWAANSSNLWEALFDRNQVMQRTGIEKEELRRGAQQIRDYFKSDVEPLDVVINSRGMKVSFFDQREVAHMADVKRLFQGTFLVHAIAGGVLGSIAVVGLGVFRRRFFRPLAWMSMAGGGLTILFVGLIGIAALINFGAVFTSFHLISFSNDLWKSNGNLVRMFPLGFWRDITVLIGVFSALQALLFILCGCITLKGVRTVKAVQKDSNSGATTDSSSRRL